jgi:hypothetical protein
MARTTIAIDDDLLKRLEEKSAHEHRPLQDVANELLREALAEPPARNPIRLRLHGWKAKQQPGIDLLDRDKLFDVMDGR